MSISTRGRIIGYLRVASHSVAELAQLLDVTDNAVRAHLSTLERDGIVQQCGLKAGVRKPHFAYELTADAELLFPKSLGVVFNQFLAVLGERVSPEEAGELFAEVAHRLAAQTAKDVKDLSLEERVQAVVDLVSGLGGLAEVERHSDHLLVHGISCPFASVVCEHSSVCQMVGMLVSEIAQAPVREHCDRGEKVQCYFEVEMK